MNKPQTNTPQPTEPVASVPQSVKPQPGRAASAPTRPLPYAALPKRLGAAFIDLAILAGPYYFVTYLLYMVLGYEDSGLISLISFLVTAVIFWFYCVKQETSPQQATFGKCILKLKVTDLNCHTISSEQATKRCLGCIVMTGLVSVPFTEKKQALHDIFSSTLVLDSEPGPHSAAE